MACHRPTDLAHAPKPDHFYFKPPVLHWFYSELVRICTTSPGISAPGTDSHRNRTTFASNRSGSALVLLGTGPNLHHFARNIRPRDRLAPKPDQFNFKPLRLRTSFTPNWFDLHHLARDIRPRDRFAPKPDRFNFKPLRFRTGFAPNRFEFPPIRPEYPPRNKFPGSVRFFVFWPMRARLDLGLKGISSSQFSLSPASAQPHPSSQPSLSPAPVQG